MLLALVGLPFIVTFPRDEHSIEYSAPFADDCGIKIGFLNDFIIIFMSPYLIIV